MAPSSTSSQPVRGRLGSYSMLSPLGRSNSIVTLEDDLSYSDKGLPPEDEPTRERVSAAPILDHASPAISEDEEYGLEGIKPSFYQVHAGQRRAKIPDQVVTATEPNESNGTATGSVQTNGTRSRRKSGKRSRSGDPVATLGEKTKLRNVKLQWAKQRDSEKVLLGAEVVDPQTSVGDESQKYVSWQHTERNTLSFDQLLELVVDARKRGLQESEVRLTRRMIRRVRENAERTFVGGSFLIPLALRYDNADLSKYNAGKSSTFLAFPYFHVRREISRLCGKNEPFHPMRTLLQSCYRLNDTSERDKTQCIRMLSRKSLRSCIDAEETEQVSKNVKEELIFVPQLWALILGLDRLLTLASSNDACLQGNTFHMTDETNGNHAKRCSLVRIQFKNEGRLEHLTYPIDQCSSWFGLVNKHQQIRGILKNERESAGSEEYTLTVSGRKIEAETWISVQECCADEVLNIWMRTPKPRPRRATNKSVPRLSVGNADSTDHSEVEQDAAPEKEEESEHEGDEAASQNEEPVTFQKILKVPIVKPFLEWQIVDESGEIDEIAFEERISRFLNSICQSLPAKLKGSRTTLPTTPGTATTATRDAIQRRPKLQVYGRTIRDVQTVVDRIDADKPEVHSTRAKAVFAGTQKLISFFVPIAHKSESYPAQLLWGMVYDVLSRVSMPSSYQYNC